MFKILLGLTAGALTTFSLVPQLVKILETKHTKDLSLHMYLILTTGVFLWFIYGLLIKDIVVISANFISLILALMIVLLKIKYG